MGGTYSDMSGHRMTSPQKTRLFSIEKVRSSPRVARLRRRRDAQQGAARKGDDNLASHGNRVANRGLARASITLHFRPSRPMINRYETQREHQIDPRGSVP